MIFTPFAFGSYLNLLRFNFKGFHYFRAVVENITMNALHQQTANGDGNNDKRTSKPSIK